MEVSGSSTLKLQGTVKTQRTGTRRQAEERARKTTQSPGQSRKNGLGGRHGKTEELDPTAKAGESDYWTPTPREDLRDTNRRLTKKDKEVRTRGSTAPKIDTAAYKDSPQMEVGLDQGRAEREREGQTRTKRDLKPGAPVRSKQGANPPRVRKLHGQLAQG